jgi:DNA-binding MarR family transcriptional regulator
MPLSTALVFVVVLSLPDGARQFDLAESCKMTPCRLFRHIQILERLELITSETDGDDARYRIINLTQRGRAVALRMRKGIQGGRL